MLRHLPLLLPNRSSLAQIAATVGSVAVMLFGGGGSAAAPEAQVHPVQQQQYQSNISCEVQAKGTLQ